MVQMSSTSSTSKGGFTLCNAVASNEAIEKRQGRTMLLATWLHATHLACLHYAARLQRRDIHLSPAHRVAPLSHSNESVASGGGIWESIYARRGFIFLDMNKNHFHLVIKKFKPIKSHKVSLFYM